MKAEPMSRTTFLRRPVLALAAVSCVAAGLVGGAAGTASAGTGPTEIVIDAVTSATSAPGGTPTGAVPYVLVKAGQTFTVDVSFYDSNGNPAFFNNDTALTIASNRAGLSTLSAIARKNETTAHLTANMSIPVNQVSLTVAPTKPSIARTVAADTTDPDQLFDVLTDLRLETSAPGFDKGIGGESDCTIATRADPVCGRVLLPQGSASPSVLLSLGACDLTYAGCGSTRGSVVQALADLTGHYTKSSPATIVVACDKTLCGTGSIQSKRLSFSLRGNTSLGAAPSCPAKNTIGAAQTACVDYVQSKRDGSGDTFLYFLFTEDARVSVG
jgi:hypothetical protein